jgi:hypothetical protein
MQADKFLSIYLSLSPETKAQMDEKIERMKEQEEKRSSLEEIINNLSPQERLARNEEQKEYLDEKKKDREEIKKANFTAQDEEEEKWDRQTELSNLEDEIQETLTTEYPLGIEILQREIDQAEDELLKLIKANISNQTKEK